MHGIIRAPLCARKERALTAAKLGAALSREVERAEAVGDEMAAASCSRRDTSLPPLMSPLRTATIGPNCVAQHPVDDTTVKYLPASFCPGWPATPVALVRRSAPLVRARWS